MVSGSDTDFKVVGEATNRYIVKLGPSDAEIRLEEV